MRTMVLGAAALLLACGGCKSKDSQGAAAPSERAKLLNEVAAVMATVKDKGTAQEAKPKLLELADRLKKISEDDQKLYPAGTTRPEMSESQKKQLDEAKTKFRGECARLSTVDGGRELVDDFMERFAASAAEKK